MSRVLQTPLCICVCLCLLSLPLRVLRYDAAISSAWRRFRESNPDPVGMHVSCAADTPSAILKMRAGSFFYSCAADPLYVCGRVPGSIAPGGYQWAPRLQSCLLYWRCFPLPPSSAVVELIHFMCRESASAVETFFPSAHYGVRHVLARVDCSGIIRPAFRASDAHFLLPCPALARADLAARCRACSLLFL